MRFSTIVSVACSVLSAQAVRILQSNDDGWAELYIRSLHDELLAARHDPIISGPADNKSGTGSNDKPPWPRAEPCQYGSCPKLSGVVGSNSTDKRMHWVNSMPVTSTRYGITTFAPMVWGRGKTPELVVAGPNVGTNLFIQVPFSGTVGAATYAVKQGIPAVAFSGASGGNLPWNHRPVPLRSQIYAKLAANFVNKLTAKKPYLPGNVWLNINFPEVKPGECDSVDKFSWVLTRINPGIFSPQDVLHCGLHRLPQESDVIHSGKCRISVSVGNAETKRTAPKEDQKVVLEKLPKLFSCMP